MNEISERLKNQSHESSTRRTYHKIWTKFNNFCIRLDNMPDTWEERTRMYCSFLIYEEQLQSSTVKTYISAIKAIVTSDGYVWDKQYLLLTSLIKSCKKVNDTVKTRLPIRKPLLERILTQTDLQFSQINPQPYLRILYMTIFTIMYYGLMRVGEVANSAHSLKAVDIHVSHCKSKILLILRSSKTHGRGDRPQKISIKADFLEVEVNGQRCSTFSKKTIKYNPVTMIRTYLKTRAGWTDRQENLFVFSDGTPVQPAHVRDLLRKMLKNLDLNGSLYDTHSFRIGRATDLHKMNFPVEKIKELGRWRSNAVYEYLRFS